MEEKSEVLTLDLAKTLDVTVQTVRADLKKLEEMGQVKRFHGGAQKIDTVENFDARIVKNKEEKMKMAKYIASTIRENETIFFDGGTTMMYIIQNLPSDINVVTASIAIANESTRLINSEIYSLGGVVNKISKEVYGSQAKAEIERLTFDKAILGVTGISLESGFTENNMLSLEIKKEVLKNTTESIVIADSSKFGIKGMYKAFDFEEIDKVITTSEFHKKDLNIFKLE
ncbi:DeoR/GlpR family DNA-binding transcription regulator [Aerococcus urinaeequi]|uniref:DeoR/GlpR family DNA-binding transcription regulator n=1 Tax=Aerococcus urinaeequi TaxID=51665 RepID=UPI002109DD3F|nr:DeoR/GlpR family DNA-binding transcription regulator [Aerococcus urinaeequi]